MRGNVALRVGLLLAVGIAGAAASMAATRSRWGGYELR